MARSGFISGLGRNQKDRTMKVFIIAMFSISLLAGCQQEADDMRAPAAITLTPDAVGHFCEMQIMMHEGPKAQIHLADVKDPLWFAQVRDGIAYLKSPEKSAEITSFYVNDMGAAKSWANPGIDNWIEADKAYYVVGSNARGGMGAPELVPFASRELAEKFASDKGGEIMMLSEIPAATVLSPVEMDGAPMSGMKMNHSKDMKKE